MLREMHMGTLGSNWGLQRRVSLFCFVFFLGNTGPAFPTALAFPVPLSLL